MPTGTVLRGNPRVSASKTVVPTKGQSFSGRLLLLVVGWVLIATAIAALIRLDIGVAPYAALNVGLGTLLGVAPGTAMWASGSILVALAWFLGHRPGPATPLGLLTIGFLVNAALPLVSFLEDVRFKEVIFILAVLVLFQGVCLTIVSSYGAGPIEVLVLALRGRGLSLRASSWGVEFASAGIGFLLGGPVNLLTMLFVLLAGPVIAVLLPLTTRIFGHR